jgi:hypothetical protein
MSVFDLRILFTDLKTENFTWAKIIRPIINKSRELQRKNQINILPLIDLELINIYLSSII